MNRLGERHVRAVGTHIVVQTIRQLFRVTCSNLAVQVQGGRVEAGLLHALVLVVCREQAFFALQFAQCFFIGHERQLRHIEGRAIGLGVTALHQLFQAFELARGQTSLELSRLGADRSDVRLAVELDLGLKHFAPGDGGQRSGHGRCGFGQDRLAVKDQRIKQRRLSCFHTANNTDVHQPVLVLQCLACLCELLRLVDAVHPLELLDFALKQVLITSC